jgi:hypothetical protein
VRVPTPEAQKLDKLTLEELKAKRKDARDPSDIKASLVTHPSDDDKKKGKGIVQFRKRIAMVRLLPLKAIITTKRVAERKLTILRLLARTHTQAHLASSHVHLTFPAQFYHLHDKEHGGFLAAGE